MKFRTSILLAALTAVGAFAGTSAKPRVPYTFEQNQGQAPPQVKFLARGEGYNLFLTANEAVLTLARDQHTQQVVRMSLDGGLPARAIQARDRSTQTTNYLIGNNPANWRTNLPHYKRVHYNGVYDGIDLVYHSSEGRLEYDFVLAAGVSPNAIQLRFDGPQSARINKAGALELSFGARKLIHQAPIAYQESRGRRIPVAASYRLLKNNRIGFEVGPHDPALPLTIDPVVIYSTYLGGDRNDLVNAVATDPQGNTYVTGETTSTNLPVVGTNLINNQFAVVFSFVTKYNANGTAIVYSSYLGGSSNTRGYAIDVDGAGNAFLGGVTGAKDFPLVNPVQTNHPGLNIGYVAKLNPAGNALLFSTFLGGERNDEVRGLVLDRDGNIHVTGRATSTQFPTANAIQPNFGGSSDAFAALYTAPNYRIGYSTYLGGAAAEEGTAVAVDNSGNTFLTGFALGGGMATPGAFQTLISSPNDAYVARINTAGTNLDWFTYYGGRGDDKAYAIAIDANGNVVVGGSTSSNNLPSTATAIQPALNGDADAFLARFSRTGNDLFYASYFGSSATRMSVAETINAIDIDALGAVIIAGTINGADFPTARPVQTYGGGSADGFVARLTPALDAIDFSTPIGGAANDLLLGMAVDNAGGVHVGGDTVSADFPLKNPLRNTFAGGREGFVTLICDPVLIASSNHLDFVFQTGKAVPPAQNVQISACAPIPYQIEVTEGAFLSATPLNGTTNGATAVSVNPAGLEPGTYQGRLRVSAPDAVNSPITISVVLQVVGPPPVTSAAGIVHAATALGGPIAPGELIVIYGDNMAGSGLNLAELDTLGQMSRVIKGTRVYFDGIQGALVYTSARQLSVVVPYSVAGKATVSIEVEYLGFRSAPVVVPVAQTSPGIFTANATGGGQGAILNQDYSVNNAGNPAARGAVILIYATGEGQTDPQGVDGLITSGVLRKPLAPVTVTIGGVPADVLYAGAAPGLVSGVLQINAVVPAGIDPGAAEIRVTIGGVTSPAGVTVAVK